MKNTQEIKQKKSTNKIVEKRYTDPKTGKFKKGNPGGGRPKGTFSITALVKEELQRCPDIKDKQTYADLIIKRIMSKAIKDGDGRMIERIWAYMDGLPKETRDLNIKLPKPILDITNGISKDNSNIKDNITEPED